MRRLNEFFRREEKDSRPTKDPSRDSRVEAQNIYAQFFLCFFFPSFATNGSTIHTMPQKT